jgi:hypothetical protein
MCYRRATVDQSDINLSIVLVLENVNILNKLCVQCLYVIQSAVALWLDHCMPVGFNSGFLLLTSLIHVSNDVACDLRLIFRNTMTENSLQGNI